MSDDTISDTTIGNAIAMNGAGTRMVASSSTHIHIYDKSTEGTWTETQDILISDADVVVDMSTDGNTIVLGFPNANTNAGVVKIYKYTTSAWSLSTSLQGGDYDFFGSSLAINEDGTRIAIGAVEREIATHNTTQKGYVKVYEYSDSNWTQIGDSIEGENSKDEFGSSLAMNEGGNIIAIGGISASENVTTNASILRFTPPWMNGSTTAGATITQDVGHVKVYEYSDSNWTQKGSTIDGNEQYDQFGFSVAMDKDCLLYTS